MESVRQLTFVCLCAIAGNGVSAQPPDAVFDDLRQRLESLDSLLRFDPDARTLPVSTLVSDPELADLTGPVPTQFSPQTTANTIASPVDISVTNPGWHSRFFRRPMATRTTPTLSGRRAPAG